MPALRALHLPECGLPEQNALPASCFSQLEVRPKISDAKLSVRCNNNMMCCMLPPARQAACLTFDLPLKRGSMSHTGEIDACEQL